MIKRVVLLNGPPGSGKDTIGNACIDHFKGHTAAFKDTLYQHTAYLFKVDVKWLTWAATCRVTKETPLPELQGFTPREALIFTAEEVYKKIYGKDYFGKSIASTLKDGLTFITDAGFKAEAIAIIEEVGAENVIHFKLYRDGCSFEGDSRSYYDLSEYEVFTATLWNNSTIERILADMKTVLDLEGWI